LLLVLQLQHVLVLLVLCCNRRRIPRQHASERLTSSD
jgi:hypothetical protein